MNLSPETIEFLKKAEGKKIVFTNGCFDILHKGHISYLNQAKALGDFLIIGLNSDRSVSELKGPTRPINKENDRKFVMQNLKAVDCVEIFDQETPLELIKLIKPSILVKGGDWPVEKIVGAKEVIANGGKVMSLPFVDGFSTTNIVNKILDQ